MTAAVQPESDEPIELAPAERWHDIGRGGATGFWGALGAAFAVHALLAALLTGGLDGVLAPLFGARTERSIGDKAGVIDGVAAEVIDAAEFNKRYVAFRAGNAEADVEAASQASTPPAEPQPIEAPVTELKPADGFETATIEPTRPSPERQEEAPSKPALSEAEMRQLLSDSMEDLQSALVSVSTPGAARLGEASPFVKSVIRTLKINMPKPRGMKGVVVVQFMVGATGAIEAIRVVRSSGRGDLDRFVAERVYNTRLTAPPPNATPRERLFQISYEYK